MSDALAVAAVTATLQRLLLNELKADVSGTEVTTRPLDKARADSAAENQVNLFLYQVALDPAWRNRDLPWRVGSGESAPPTLALNLYYLLTAYYGQSEDAVATSADKSKLLGSHRLLGKAMSVLHENPVLDRSAIHDILPSDEQDAHPYDQLEHIRVTPQALSVDDLSKLWSGFQTQFRLSAAYEVSVVLIEGEAASRAPLPALRRGPEDRGVASLIGPFPVLAEVKPPEPHRSGRLGDVLTLTGRNLGGDSVAVRFTHTFLPLVEELDPAAGATAERLEVELPDDAAAQDDWACGFYRVGVVARQGQDPERLSNELPLPLAPRVTVEPSPGGDLTFQPDANGTVTLRLTCRPKVSDRQAVRLILGERQVSAPSPAAPTDTLTFEIDNAPVGEFLVRLRIDGVDSVPVVGTAVGLGFDPQQKVKIQ